MYPKIQNLAHYDGCSEMKKTNIEPHKTESFRILALKINLEIKKNSSKVNATKICQKNPFFFSKEQNTCQIIFRPSICSIITDLINAKSLTFGYICFSSERFSHFNSFVFFSSFSFPSIFFFSFLHYIFCSFHF